jgi:hypothetical protein
MPFQENRIEMGLQMQLIFVHHSLVARHMRHGQEKEVDSKYRIILEASCPAFPANTGTITDLDTGSLFDHIYDSNDDLFQIHLAMHFSLKIINRNNNAWLNGH